MHVNRAGQWVVQALVAALAPFVANGVRASEFLLPLNGDNVIGAVSIAVAEHEDTLLDIGRRYGVGYEEVIAANPGVDPWLPGEGTEILIPGRFVLPDAPREGIVVNLPEHRLYYYPAAKAGEPRVVRTYPISVGKMDWKTPLGATKVVAKQEKPNWYPPQSVRLEHIAKGDPLPPFIPPGPDNPLGEYVLRLGIPSGAYLIHGTNRPAGVGMQVTHGCIRMFPEDISEFYTMIPVNTKVNLVDQTTKVGWSRGTLFVERQSPLEGTDNPAHMDSAELSRALQAATAGLAADVDWDTARLAFQQASGVPVRVGERNFSRVPAPPAAEGAPEQVPEPAPESVENVAQATE
jgi:L,D-transpeptidase ErfK/SrfK